MEDEEFSPDYADDFGPEPAEPAVPSAEAKEAEIRRIIGELEQEALDRVDKRQPIEQRWLEDLRQYHGQYDHDTLTAIKENSGASAFVNLTGPKTDAMAARLMDLLFPTDDRNWGIKPTPVPELTDQAKQAAQLADQKQKEAMAQAEQAGAGEGGDPAAADPAMIAQAQQAQAEADQAKAYADQLRGIIAEGEKRAENMAREIEDQLTQSSYAAICRDVIEDACKLGTGVAEGPVTGMRVRKGWKQQPVMEPEVDAFGNPVVGPDGQPKMRQVMGPDGNPVMGDYALQMVEGEDPAMVYVNIWDFFPDMGVPKTEQGRGTFVRHLYNDRDVRRLAKLKGFDAENIRKLLKEKPTQAEPSYVADLRAMGEKTSTDSPQVYHVWKYSGPLEAEDMLKLALAMGEDETALEVGEADPLQEFHAVVWFCQGIPLKFSIYPMDSDECMYSVFTLKRDEYSVFGYGIPWIMRDLQSSVNAGWRNMLDNAAIAAGPQLIFDRDMVEPVDGDYTIRPRKQWNVKRPWEGNNPPMWAVQFPMMQAELANIIAISRDLLNEVTAMPMIAQGEQGSNVTRTAQGMTLLMNSANVNFRRYVKNFDDDFTVPTIRRFYDWNMQHSRKEEIKGDYEVDARGSSVLLVREMQASNLFMIALQLGAHPVYGPMLENRAVLRKLFQAHMISSDEMVLSDDEIDAILAKAAAQAEQDQKAMADQQMAQMQMQVKMAELDMKQRELEAKISIANMQKNVDLQIATMRYEEGMQKVATQANIKMDELDAKSRVEDAKIQAGERKHAVELATTQRIGPSGGGMY